jgi:hypothetical protein
MSSTSISLGWECGSAWHGIHHGLRVTKEQGYKTCPFDLMNTNYEGVVQCLRDDFKYLCDPDYLKLITLPQDYFKILGYHGGDKLIVNTKYKFIFTHESPNHGTLHLHENWANGPFTFCENNFKEFIRRYQNRIQNFKEYAESNTHIYFIIAKDKCVGTNSELVNVIREKYPTCHFTLLELDEPDKSTIYNECMEFMNTNFYGNL